MESAMTSRCLSTGVRQKSGQCLLHKNVPSVKTESLRKEKHFPACCVQVKKEETKQTERKNNPQKEQRKFNPTPASEAAFCDFACTRGFPT